MPPACSELLTCSATSKQPRLIRREWAEGFAAGPKSRKESNRGQFYLLKAQASSTVKWRCWSLPLPPFIFSASAFTSDLPNPSHSIPKHTLSSLQSRPTELLIDQYSFYSCCFYLDLRGHKL